MVVGCGKKEQPNAGKPAPTTNANKGNGTEAEPVKELTAEEKVVGEYEIKKDGNTLKQVYLENGVIESYRNGKKVEELKWSISKEGELHCLDKDGDIGVFRINPDDSITFIVVILKDGKRLDLPKDKQDTLKKIK